MIDGLLYVHVYIYHGIFVKDKGLLVSNYAISHEEVWGNGRVISCVLNVGTRWK
jgi:hypothetical protein